MADTKISALPASTTPLAGTEVLPVVQSGTTKNVSVANLTAGRAVSAASLALTGTPLPVTSGGSGTSTAFTAGSVVFAGASGVYSQDNTNLFWDDANNRLGLGTATPVSTLELQGATPVETISNNSNVSTTTGTVYSTLAMRSLKGGGAGSFAYDDAWIQTQRSNYNYNSDFFTHDSKLVFFTNDSNRDNDPTARMSLDAQGLTLLNNSNLVIGTSGKAIKDSTGAVALAFTSLKTELSGAPYVEGRSSGSPTYGVITDNRYVGPNSATDFFKVELSDDYGTALIELCVSGRGSNGANFYFQGHRYVAVNGGSSISTTTVGTDQTSGNITFTLTWTTTNTFKITFTQTQTGVNFFGVVTATLKAAGGGDNTAGTIATLTYL